MKFIPSLPEIIREIRETLGFLAGTDRSFRKDVLMYALVVYLFFSKQQDLAYYRSEIDSINERNEIKEQQYRRDYNMIMYLWKNDVKHFSRVFQNVQDETAKIKLETEKLNSKEEK